MAKEWYILHTYSGYENKVEKFIRSYMEEPEFSKTVLDIKVPTEEVPIEGKDGKKKTVVRKFLPGYVLLEMDLAEGDWLDSLRKIKKIAGASGFVGTRGNEKPHPIPTDEIKSILQRAGELKTNKHVMMKQTFEVGETVKIVEGPFDTFVGKIDELNLEKGKAKVMVGILGRFTPVEVELSQVEKI